MVKSSPNERFREKHSKSNEKLGSWFETHTKELFSSKSISTLLFFEKCIICKELFHIFVAIGCSNLPSGQSCAAPAAMAALSTRRTSKAWLQANPQDRGFLKPRLLRAWSLDSLMFETNFSRKFSTKTKKHQIRAKK